MEDILYEVKVNGLKTPDGSIPMVALKELCDGLIESSERALRLSIEGSSVKKGKVPSWLKKSVQFTITGIRKGSTVVEITAPTLDQAAPTQIKQQDLWYKLPDPEDTAITLLSKSIIDATSDKLESEYFDGGVLKSILSFKPFLKDYARSFELDSRIRPKEHFAIGAEQIEKVEQMKVKIPEPRAVVVSGFFNLIEHKGGHYKLELENGEKISGAIEPNFIEIENMRALWGEKVTLKGTAHFLPSGKVRYVKAEVIKPFQTGEEIFQSIPKSQLPFEFIEDLKKRHKTTSPLLEIWDEWPGEETIDELLDALKETNKLD